MSEKFESFEKPESSDKQDNDIGMQSIQGKIKPNSEVVEEANLNMYSETSEPKYQVGEDIIEYKNRLKEFNENMLKKEINEREEYDQVWKSTHDNKGS